MSRRAVHPVALAVGLGMDLLGARSAFAVTGYVSGTWQFWNQNGNYCPSANACTGAQYVQSQYDTTLPISNALVWVVDSSFSIIGSGGTDNAGNYAVTWSRSTFPSQIGLVILPYQKDGRFYFANTAGQYINNWTGLLTTSSSSSPGSPQYIGTWWVGSSSAPDPFYNSYWAAEWQWRRVMSLVGVLISSFTNVEVRGFQNTIPGYISAQGFCQTSCSSGATKQVHLDDNAGLQPQARSMHELGHVAEYLTHAWTIQNSSGVSALDYKWAPAGQNPDLYFGWYPDFAEWGSAAFEEAFATHYGNIAFWGDNAVQPTTCGSSLTCYNGSDPALHTDIELTSYPFSVNNCGVSPDNPEARWPLSQMRFFWDVFDNHNDADGDAYTANAGDFWKHLANLAWYPAGTSTWQIDEVWNSSRSSLDNRDGRGATSYQQNYANNVADISILRTDNCLPP